MTTIKLKDPIDLVEGNQKSELEFGKPRLVHVQKFVVAIGPDTISALINRDPEKENPALGPDTVKELLRAVISDERFQKFNVALAFYLGISEQQCEQLSLPDLVEIGKVIFGFFSEIAEMIQELLD